MRLGRGVEDGVEVGEPPARARSARSRSSARPSCAPTVPIASTTRSSCASASSTKKDEERDHLTADEHGHRPLPSSSRGAFRLRRPARLSNHACSAGLERSVRASSTCREAVPRRRSPGGTRHQGLRDRPRTRRAAFPGWSPSKAGPPCRRASPSASRRARCRRRPPLSVLAASLAAVAPSRAGARRAASPAAASPGSGAAPGARPSGGRARRARSRCASGEVARRPVQDAERAELRGRRR